MTDELPFLDTHTVSVALGPEAVWEAVVRYADQLGFGRFHPVPVVLGTVPRSGFAPRVEEPGRRLALEGRHRFSRYRLVLEVEPRTTERTTLLHAHSYAVFPGITGKAYRALVVGTRLHVVATRAVLHSLRRSAGT